MPRIAPWIWRRLGFPFNWVAIAFAMAGLALVGSLAAIALLVQVGVVPRASFWSWFRGNIRISIVVTLTMGLFITAYEMMRARVAAVVSLGSASRAKKPWAMISRSGTGAAVWRKSRTM